MNRNRLERVLAEMRGKGISQLLVTDPVSIFYLTGIDIDPMERFFGVYINTAGNHRMFINKLFMAPQDIGIEKVWLSDTDDIMGLVGGAADPAAPLGVDKTLEARFLLPLMEKNAASAYVNGSECLDNARARKDEEEQVKMRLVSRLNDMAMARIQKHIRKGVSEAELTEALMGIYKELGADGPSFEPIIAFGANAAEGHHVSDGTVLKEGDCIVMDIGCKKDGYCADMTRTFFYKKADDKYRRIFDTVLRANETAESLIRPGVRFCDLDAAARDIINKGGYGSGFTHRLGHGIGLEVHEGGDVSAANTGVVQPGMTFSIEPGVYLPGEFGVRIEDLVLVTENGCEILNSVPKQLEIIE